MASVSEKHQGHFLRQTQDSRTEEDKPRFSRIDGCATAPRKVCFAMQFDLCNQRFYQITSGRELGLEVEPAARLCFERSDGRAALEVTRHQGHGGGLGGFGWLRVASGGFGWLRVASGGFGWLRVASVGCEASPGGWTGITRFSWPGLGFGSDRIVGLSRERLSASLLVWRFGAQSTNPKVTD